MRCDAGRLGGAHGSRAESGGHVSGDWGTLSVEDWKANEKALGTGARIFSAYHLRTEVKIWVITEADRSATTILLPEEY